MTKNEDESRKTLPRSSPVTQPFWDGARNGKLMLQRCHDCGFTQFYPRPWCTNCGSLGLEWTEASGKGMVYSYTIPRRVIDNAEGFAADIPFVIGIIELEEGPRMYSNIVGCRPEEVSIGAAVEVVFEDASDEIKLPKFRLVKQGR